MVLIASFSFQVITSSYIIILLHIQSSLNGRKTKRQNTSYEVACFPRNVNVMLIITGLNFKSSYAGAITHLTNITLLLRMEMV